MNNKIKYIKRIKLCPKLHKRCSCSGMITARSYVDYSFGINDSNKMRILLTKVNIDDISIDHVWVKSKELNDSRKYPKGTKICFNALVSSYQKVNGAIGIGLIDLKKIQIHKSKIIFLRQKNNLVIKSIR